MTTDGHTYERTEIEKWFAPGMSSHPRRWVPLVGMMGQTTVVLDLVCGDTPTSVQCHEIETTLIQRETQKCPVNKNNSFFCCGIDEW
jgi:cell wall assembly regulator SMI1